MPFGLTCAPNVFQRLTDLVLCGLTYETCLVYLDDIIVFSPDFDRHVERLEEIFRRLRAANLKLHIKKCSLFQQRVHFLGHVLAESGIEVQPEKVSVVQQWPVTRSLTELDPVIRGPLFVLSSIHSWVCGHRSAITCIDSEKCTV